MQQWPADVNNHSDKRFPAFFGAQALMSTLVSQNESSRQMKILHL
jgi:hypothetical protein